MKKKRTPPSSAVSADAGGVDDSFRQRASARAEERADCVADQPRNERTRMPSPSSRNVTVRSLPRLPSMPGYGAA